jgi:2-succinyl-5-enolpyruvyl-6-hydroxy-3-cyclohexene-1-carboxylate synthase
LITRALSKDTFSSQYAPELVISVGGNYVSQIKGLLKGCTQDFEHWTINEEGVVVDQFKMLTKIFECSEIEFFRYFSQQNEEERSENEYLKLWNDKINSMPQPQFTYSSNYAMQEFLKVVPKNSLIHYGNGVSAHISQYFPVDSSLEHYCHTGTTTIDGSVSTFIGQSSATERLAFLFVGDLSFFYDMNGIWNRYVKNNVRILIYNNEGGETFHWNAAKDIDTLPQHISAEHFASAKGWVESRGFKYLSSHNQEEFDDELPEFMVSESNQPIVFEVFTKKDTDAKMLMAYYDEIRKVLN